MNRRFYWGLAILIIILGVAAVFVIQNELVTNQQFKDELVEAEKLEKMMNQLKVSENNPPPNEPGYKWVWHHDHWDKVLISNPTGPIAHHDVPTAEEPDISVYDGKPLDEDFFRNMFSREELESMLKTDQRYVERIQTKNIPRLEDLLKRQLERIKGVPDYMNEPLKKGIARTETYLNQYKFEVNNLKSDIALISNVLNEEVNRVEE